MPLSSGNATKSFTFGFLQSNLALVRLASKNWCYTKENESFFGFQRVEDNADIRKRVQISNLKLKILFDDRVMPFSQYMKIDSIEEFSNLLKSVDDIEHCNVKNDLGKILEDS